MAVDVETASQAVTLADKVGIVALLVFLLGLALWAGWRMVLYFLKRSEASERKCEERYQEVAAEIVSVRKAHEALLGGLAHETRVSLDASTKVIERNVLAFERLSDVIKDNKEETDEIVRPPAKHKSPSRQLFGIAIALLMLGGCFRSEAQTATNKEDQITVAGTAEVPGVGSVPVTLRIDRKGTEDATTESKTQIDGKAIGQELGAAAGQAIRAGFAQVLPAFAEATRSSSPLGGLGLDGAGIAASLVTAASAYALNRTKEDSRKRAEERARAEAQARAEAEAKAREYAERLPPPGA